MTLEVGVLSKLVVMFGPSFKNLGGGMVSKQFEEMCPRLVPLSNRNGGFCRKLRDIKNMTLGGCRIAMRGVMCKEF